MLAGVMKTETVMFKVSSEMQTYPKVKSFFFIPQYNADLCLPVF